MMHVNFISATDRPYKCRETFFKKKQDEKMSISENPSGYLVKIDILLILINGRKYDGSELSTDIIIGMDLRGFGQW